MENKRISNKIVGSFLLLALACLMPLSLAAQTHWQPQSASYEDNMTLTGVIQINGVEQQSLAYEVGAFCGTECRGAERTVLFPGSQRYVVMLTIFGNSGDQITFKLYDHNQGVELDLVSPDAVTFNSSGYGTLMNPYVLNFTSPIYTISASASPTAGGTVSGAGNYQSGSACTLTATPNTGYTFVRWTKNGTQVSTSESYTFMVTEAASYVAVFSLNSYTISASASPSAGGTVSGGGTYSHGSTCNLTATPNTGYTFTNWTKNGAVVSTSASYTFTVTSGGTYVANFNEVEDYIVFADPNVKAICVANWDTNGSGELSYAEAAAVTSLGEVFRGDTTITSFEELQYFTGLSTISANAFRDCSNLTGALYIPNSVTSIGNYAFYNCSGLTGSLTIPNYVTYIGHQAFNHCSGFTGSLTIPNSVTSIESYAFGYCSGFTGSLTISNSVTSIGYYAFGHCSGFTGSLTIPNSVTSIEDHAFCYCSGFTGSLTISNSVTSIGEDAFGYCSSFTGSLAIPNSVTSIGRWAFAFCSGFTGTLTIPNSVTSIGDLTFGYCSGFTGTLTIPNSVTSIGYHAFYNCSGFTGTLTIPNSVTSIGNNAFVNCSGFTTMNILPETPPTLGNGVFNGVPKSIPVNVPCAFIASYQEADGWSEFTNYHGIGCPSFAVSATTNPAEGGTISGAGTYDEGATCTLTATANTGYTFVNWTENGEVVSTEATYSFTVTGDRELVANFALQSYTISASADPTAGGSVSGAGSYNYGSSCILTAVANTGYTFDNWTENGTIISTAAVYSFEVTGSHTLVANFADATGTGKLSGVFSVGEHTHIQFSQGNLQYQASTNTWRFATNQFDYVGSDNNIISETYSGWIDLFGWGTSGYNHGAVCYQPWSTSQTNSDYNAYGQYNFNLYDQTGQADWGYNAISNGGNTVNNGWRTLTGGSGGEWDYVFNTRSTASGIRYAKAQLNGVNGVILLPDDWSANYYSLSNTNQGDASYTSNVISSSQWSSLEQHGAVFLPAAGDRFGSVYRVGIEGAYYSASYNDGIRAHYLDFADARLRTSAAYGRGGGLSVRLVCPAENYSYEINATPNPTEGGMVSGGGTYQEGVTCTLTATANTGYTFQNWTENGEVVSTEATYSFIVMSDRNLVASFNPPLSSISDDFNDGVINPEYWTATGPNIYEEDGMIKIQQNRTDNYVALESLPFMIPADSIIVMERRFLIHDQYHNSSWGNRFFYGNINIKLNGSDDNYIGICYYDDDYDNRHGTYIRTQINGEVNETRICDAVFDTWLTEGVILDLNENTLTYCRDFCPIVTVAIPNVSPDYVTFRFKPDGWWTGHYHNMDYIKINVEAPDNCSITVSTSPEEGGIATGGGEYEYLSVCTLIAEPNQGYDFMYWTDNGDQVSYDAECFFVVTPNRELVAHFTLPLTISATADPAEGGTVSGMGEYEYNTTCTMTATPNEGYTFMYWTENGNQVSTSASYSFTVTTDRELVAHFMIKPVITVAINPAEGGTVSGMGEFDYNTTCTLMATPNLGYLFLNWSRNGSVVSSNATYSFTVTEDVNLEAVFSPLNGLSIGEGEAAIYYLPSYSLYNYTLSQQIYTPEEIGGSNGINSIAFFNAGGTKTRNYDIYMVHTEKTSFESNTDWITVSETDRVFSGNLTFNTGQWTTINLDTPFNYDGTSNLAIVVDDNSGNWSGNSMSCRVFNANGNQALRVYSDNPNYDPYNPSGYSGTLHNVKNQVIFGMSHYTITAAASDLGMGTVAGGGQYDSGATCTLMASASGDNFFTSWTENGVIVSTEPTYTFTVTRNRNLVANFSTNHWTPIVGNQYNMTVTGVISINGVEQTSTLLEVGAFCGEECRASEFAQYFPVTQQYVVTLTVRSRTLTGETITFRLYDHLQGRELDELQCVNTVTFENDANIGSIGNWFQFAFNSQVEISATVNPDGAGAVTGTGAYTLGTSATLIAEANEGFAFRDWSLNGEVVSTESTYSFVVTGATHLEANFDYVNTQDMVAGWNWWGTSVEVSGATGLEMIENSLGSNGISIKSQGQSTQNYYPETGYNYWFGSLQALDIAKGYKINVSEAAQAVMIGAMADPSLHPVTITPEWSWIGYPVGVAQNLSVALSGFTPSANDVFKGQGKTSVYYEDYGWFPDFTLQPGNSYMYKSNDAENKTLVYSIGRSTAAGGEPEHHWQPIGGNQYNMSVTGVIVIDGVEQQSTALEVGAFCGDECRASEFAQYFPVTRQYVVTMTIRSNSASGETITFRLYDHNTGMEPYGVSPNSITFETDAIVGSMNNWYQFAFVSSQTISTDLAQGWTWFAPTVQTSIEAIQTALGGAYVQILAKNGTPSGDIVPGEMYRIQTNAPRTLAVTGAPITTATITINRGENWFGYVGTEKTVTAAFEGFTPAEGDKVVSQNDGFAIYENGVWAGTLGTLQPGKGYVYVSKDAETKTLTL